MNAVNAQPISSPYYPPRVKRRLVYDERTAVDFMERAATLSSKRAAYVFGNRTLSFGDLLREVNRCAAGLAGLGVRAGDRVLLCLPNIPQLPIFTLALWRLRAVAVMSNPLYTAGELQLQVENAGCRVAVALDLMLHRLMEPAVAVKLSKVVVCHLSDYLKAPAKQLFPWIKPKLFRRVPRSEKLIELKELLRRFPEAQVAGKSALEDVAALLYTGGSTGDPKGVVLKHRNISFNAQQVTEWLNDFKDGEETVMGVFPFFTGAGLTALMCGSLLRRATVLLIPRPTPPEIFKVARRHRATLFPAVPTIYIGLMQHPNFEELARRCFGALKICLSGAAPLAAETKNRWEGVLKIPIVELYGLSECTAMATGNPYNRTKLLSVGLPISDTECKVVDLDEGKRELAQGERGEICIRGPQVCDGYYENPEATVSTIREGWLHTGDVGYLDSEGYLFIVDRKKELIIAGGYNIYPREVDEVLLRHPNVKEVATVGIPDGYRGESVKSFISCKQGRDIPVEELDALCRKHLAPYKVPRQYEFLPELPKNAMGKILKKELLPR